ncbi:Phosphate transporter family protein [Streptomyces sp. OK228]|nr:Phosphate transporter family protein [Streptomyces sp. OK228]
MDHITFLVTVVIVTALAFDFTNGFHDTANAMATSIATGALKPRTAVLIGGVLNIGGAFLSTADWSGRSGSARASTASTSTRWSRRC